MATEHIAIEVSIGRKVNHRIEFVTDCAKRDLVAIREESARGCADWLWQTAFDIQPKRFSVTAFEDAIARSGIDFGEKIDAGGRQNQRDFKCDPVMPRVILNQSIK